MSAAGHRTTLELGRRAREASRTMAIAPAAKRHAALEAIVQSMQALRRPIHAQNLEDIADAGRAGRGEAFVDRLVVNENSLEKMARGIQAVMALGDPVGEVFDASVLPNGLRVHKQRVPLGVLGVIYESRPDVTIEVAALAIKTGNAVILRGGSESHRTNTQLLRAVHAGLSDAGLPVDAVQGMTDMDRARILELLQMSECVDAIIPRGGPELQAFCRDNSRVPVITGGIGICHLYVESSADMAAALEVVRNAKVQRPTVCNALDTLLVHRDAAATFLPLVVARLAADGVTFRADGAAAALLAAGGALPPHVTAAGEGDFDTEWLSLTLGLRVVQSFEEAVAHIAKHGSAHSDGILTGDAASARRFVAEVDSAAVFVNASTRFNDGSQLGLGAEAAISTQRLHVRGPMGLRELTTYKWVVQGDYHSRA